MAEVFVSYSRNDKATLPIDFRAFHTIDLDAGTDVGRSPAFQDAVRALGNLVARSGNEGTAATPAPAARGLDVRYVVEGSVRRIADRIRISVQLVDTETGSHVWGEKFDCEQAEIFAVQDEVVQRIVATLVGRVQVTDAERARRKPPASLAANPAFTIRQFMSKEPFRNAADAEYLAESLRLAGLPE